ncbi:MAG: HD domain-containing protein [Clostridia bacterium]|nr:HD domain-containing protein [Clostridia bacterium]
MQNNINTLDKVILSTNVVENFHTEYSTNEEFQTWINETIPDLEKCSKQRQNNPWHKYNVLDHILHSIEEMNKQTTHLNHKTRRLLAYTMLFHDIGKPDSHIVREKNGEKIDSFFGHNKKSCEIAKPLLPLLNFDKIESEIILTLVDKHDIFMFIKDFPTTNPYWRTLTPNLIQEEITELNKSGDGIQLLKYLIIVGRSDNLAQNEKMTKESLAMLDKFDRMLNEYTTDTQKNLDE